MRLENNDIRDAMIEYLERRGLNVAKNENNVRMMHELKGPHVKYIATIDIETPPTVSDGGPYR